ncbi:type I secretion system permease/ATPase [uncultured Nitratireductor sp.]|uniref:type I secretion system permease/ATPase n=1 Tax=uncultured Nitratireductor sp. TaxID=520953 RepID=UPI0025D837C2|nr:type I secretion system permease/ATPase [uncultured Nitratireductor sp.]
MMGPDLEQAEVPGHNGPDLWAWIEALEHVARHYNVPFSAQGARQLAQSLETPDAAEGIVKIAKKLGLRAKPVRFRTLNSWRLPVLVELESGLVGVVAALSADRCAFVIFSGDAGQSTTIPLDDLLAETNLMVLARPERAMADERVDAYIAPYRKNWFRRIALRDLRPYAHVMLASLVANLLALAGIIFSMQVYDRVVPANSMNTLFVLFSGVLLAVFFDFIIRRLRTGILDVVGKRVDLRMSDVLFGHALRVKNQARPTSTGTFIAQLRDMEQVRELLTSTTAAAVADLPFFLLFLGIFWFIGGALVIIPAVALLLLIVPGVMAQGKLRGSAREAMREASLRNAMLVEAVQGIEDVKALQAEERFQQRWNHFNAIAADAQLRLRSITSALTGWSHTVQTSTFAVIVFFGAPIVMNGDMTTGALVACSILGSRMMAPMAQMNQVLGRLQQAKVGLKSLNTIMEMPVDHPEAEVRVSAAALRGTYRMRTAVFTYGDLSARPALTVKELNIAAGEKIAVLGKNGAGKSTILQALSGMLEPLSGEVTLDSLALGHIDPADVRRDVGLLTQNARLFHGTIRDNVTIGAPHASQEALFEALAMVGADDFIRRLPKGLDHPVQEGGLGLSGGQRQSLLLARLLIRQPTIVLLDEPTAAMDEATERQFIKRFRDWSADRTVVIATHRMRILELVERIVVFDNGRVALDNGKEDALKVLQGVKKVVPANAPGNRQVAGWEV